MNLIKENAQLLTREGELISYVQGNHFMYKLFVENDEYEIEEYVSKVEKIIARKLHIYN